MWDERADKFFSYLKWKLVWKWTSFQFPDQEYAMSYLKLDTNIPPIYAKSLDEFNSYVEKYKAPYEIILTKGGNISQSNLRNMPCCKTWKRGNRMEFHYLSSKVKLRVLYALHYDVESTKDEKLAYEALNEFAGCMNVIPTDDKEEKEELFNCPSNPDSKYYNYVNDQYLGITVNHCYSLDRNNSFSASMKEVYPQTAPWVDKYYSKRLEMKDKLNNGLITKEEYERFKLYGSIFVGWLNNPKYHRSNAWTKIVSNSNRKVHKLREYIENNGNTVLLINTDAVKFIGKVPYEGSTDLGKFKYEWEDTKMYIKGVKSYAYLDKDKWKFKQAGKCLLDKVKPREEWTLEEFKNSDTIKIARIVIKKGTNYLTEVFE